jgi:cell division protein FtsW
VAVQTAIPSATLLDGVPVTRGSVDPVYARIVMCLVVIGIVFVFSASFPTAQTLLYGTHSLYFLYRQLAFAGLGLVAMIVLAYVGPQHLVSNGVLGVASGLGLLAMILCRFGPFADETAGSACWLRLSEGLRIQPSEFVKLVYILLLARILARPVDKRYTLLQMLGRVLGALGVFLIVLLFLQKDLGMSLLVVGVTLSMLFIRGFSLLLVSALMGCSGLVGVVYAMSSPARWQRIETFLNSDSNRLEGGYQLCQMLATLARGGICGLGLGMSPDKWGPLPAPHTDSIFCVIGGELGLAGGVGLLLMFLWLAGRTFKIAERAAVPTAWYIGCGIGVTLGLQALINIAVATVSVPCTGLTLPFISYGGSSLLSSMMAAGIILSISRYKPLEREE